MNPKFSIVLPVKNEEQIIVPVLERLRASGVELLVVDGGSRDRTVEYAEKLADKVLLSPYAMRAYQMHLGALEAKGEFLIFLHADSTLPGHWQDILNASMVQPLNPPIAAAFSLAFDSSRLVFRFLAALANVRTLLTGVPQGDQGLVISRKNYFLAGGFPATPLMEEYLFWPKLRKLGKIEIYKDAVITSARRYEARGPLLNALKNSCLVSLFYFGVPPKKLAEWY
jgi:rSAM/selenodomain-associated transferase 2